jgi:hypothetical protein
VKIDVFATGHAEQWGSVIRKKDKKPPSHVSSKDSISMSPSGSRGEGGFRGGRGGERGGRGGGRGSTGRGGQRGRGGRGGAAINGHAVSPSVSGGSGITPGNSWTDIANMGATALAPTTTPMDSTDPTPKTPDGESWVSPGQETGWGNAAAAAAAASAPTPGWGASAASASTAAATPATTTSAWVADTEARGNGSAVPQQRQAQSQATPKLNTVKSKTPATSKLSWAQIARYVLSSPTVTYFWDFVCGG